MKTISLKVEDGLADWLDAEAHKLGRTKSDLVRDALEQQRRGQMGPSVHDIMKDVCGVLKGGPRDLASNKKHLKGFGRARRAA